METTQKTYKIHKRFISMQKSASNDDTRYNICGVYFDENYAASTDGHILVKKVYLPDEALHLPIKSCVNFSGKPSRRAPELLSFIQVDSGLVCIDPGEKITGILTNDLIFPDIQLIINETYKSTNPLQIPISAILLQKLVSALYHEPVEYWPIILTINPDSITAPIVVQKNCKNNADEIGVIMPMRLEC